jgi:hypothetical protein
MTRTLFFICATLLASAAPAAAASYSARPAAPSSGRFVARDITWTCGEGGCAGATRESRPVILCQSLAKHAGRIDSFLVDGRALPPSDLAKCNSAAKAIATPAVAAQ